MKENTRLSIWLIDNVVTLSPIGILANTSDWANSISSRYLPEFSNNKTKNNVYKF